MAIWDTEVIMVDGKLFAYVRVQNEYSGNICGNFRRIYKDKSGHYYAKADGCRRNMDIPVKRYFSFEQARKEYKYFYDKIVNRWEATDG